MAQQFLDQLLRSENMVGIEERQDPDCKVCLEPYGNRTSKTGGVEGGTELPVRLLCNHQVGTVCIERWLRENNSCPFCRKTLFPKARSPQDELSEEVRNLGINDDRGSLDARLRWSDLTATVRIGDLVNLDRQRPVTLHYAIAEFERVQIISRHLARVEAIRSLPMLTRDREEALNEFFNGLPRATTTVRICRQMSAELSLQHGIRLMAQNITVPLSEILEGPAHTPERRAALSIYIALHLLNADDGSVTDFLASPSIISIGQDYIRSTWALIYGNRMRLVVPEMLHILARGHMEHIQAFLPAPDSEDLIASNGRNEGSDDPNETYILDIVTIQERLYETVGNRIPIVTIKDVSDQLYTSMGTQAEIGGYRAVLETYSERARQAVGVFMACHLIGVAISYRDTAYVHELSERTLRQIYSDIYPRRSHFVEPRLTAAMGHEDIDRVLEALPALNWPSI